MKTKLTNKGSIILSFFIISILLIIIGWYKLEWINEQIIFWTNFSSIILLLGIIIRYMYIVPAIERGIFFFVQIFLFLGLILTTIIEFVTKEHIFPRSLLIIGILLLVFNLGFLEKTNK